MGLFDFLFGDNNNEPENTKDWDRIVFDTDRFRKRGSGNWVDWEDVSMGDNKSDGFENPYLDEDGEW